MASVISARITALPPPSALMMIPESSGFTNMTPQRAQQQVEKLLADGIMSQDQFQQLQQQARDFMAFLGK